MNYVGVTETILNVSVLLPSQAFPLDVQVKLKDAALCTLTQSRGQVSVHKVAGRSRPSLLPYLAPEVLLGHRPRRSADVYAFGILMWELYTGMESLGITIMCVGAVRRYGS